MDCSGRTRTPESLQREAEDDAANRRISMRVFALPEAIEKRIEAQLFLGGGVEAERRLLEALRAPGADKPAGE